jgi:Aspartyl protease
MKFHSCAQTVAERLKCYDTTMNSIFRIRHTLDSQVLLRNVGPMIPALWGKDTGTNTSEMIRGNVLLDTGARHIAIDDSVAQQLGLQAHPDKVDAHGLGGRVRLANYDAVLALPVEPVRPDPAAPPGAVYMIRIPLEVHGIAGMRENYDSQGIKPKNGLPIIGILGRTFLQFTKFTYDGLSGNLDIEIDESVRRPQKTE